MSRTPRSLHELYSLAVDKWHILISAFILSYAILFGGSGIPSFILGFQNSPPDYVWVLVVASYVIILAIVEISPETQPRSRLSKSIVVIVVLFTMVVVVFSLPFAFQSPPTPADSIGVNIKIFVSDTNDDVIGITSIEMYCEPSRSVLRAGENAYGCSPNVSNVGSDIALEGLNKLPPQTSIASLGWKLTPRTETKYKTNFTTRDLLTYSIIVAPESGAYYHSFSIDGQRIQEFVESESEQNVTVRVDNFGLYRDSSGGSGGPQRVYAEEDINGARFQNLNIIVALFAFLSIWLSTISTLHSLGDGSGDD